MPRLTGMNRRGALNPPRKTRLPCTEAGQATPSGGQPVRRSPTTGTPSSGLPPEDLDWEDPQLMADSPPNPCQPGYYMGPTTSRLIAGAGVEEMEDLNDPWGGGSAESAAGTSRRQDGPADQQMALLRDENRHLQEDVNDLRQCATQWGRPGAPAYHPDPDCYSIPQPPGWQPLGQGPVRDWDADEPPAFLSARPVLMKLPEPFEGEHDDMDRSSATATRTSKCFTTNSEGCHHSW